MYGWTHSKVMVLMSLQSSTTSLESRNWREEGGGILEFRSLIRVALILLKAAALECQLFPKLGTEIQTQGSRHRYYL